MKDFLSSYICCFCGERILWSEILKVELAKPTGSRRNPTFENQELYTHITCLEERLNPIVPFLFRTRLRGSPDETES